MHVRQNAVPFIACTVGSHASAPRHVQEQKHGGSASVKTGVVPTTLTEDALLRQLHTCPPEDVHVTIVTDRGFSDIALHHFIREGLGFNYVIRMKGNIQVTDSKGHVGPVSDWFSADGRAKSVKKACVTRQNYPVGQVICVQRPGMKLAWYLAASQPGLSPQTVINKYGRRWGIECSFRDIKDYKFGMGMTHMHTRKPDKHSSIRHNVAGWRRCVIRPTNRQVKWSLSSDRGHISSYCP